MPRNAQGQHPSVPVSTSLKETLTPDFEVSGFSHSTIAEATRSLATEELFDLQQQVEFFISLGQAHQAIEVLKAHIAESTEPSPLAYLDLLKLLHDLGQRDTYEAVRNAFNTKFNASSPPFEKYSYSRRSLERYSFALSRIQALWPSPAVLTLLERTIFRQNQSHSDEQEAIFDLEAYRELLLLYGIARELNAHASSGDGTSSLNSLFSHRRGEGTGFEVSGFPQFDPTSLQPLNASMGSDNHRQYTAPHTNPLPDLQEEVHMPDVLLDTIQTSMHTLSAFDPNATTAVPPKTTTKTTAAPETFSLEKANDLVLDFSDLDAPDSTYTIKKSGHSDPNTF
jgi:hypothetical protein